MKNTCKKLLTLALAGIMMLSLVACGSGSTKTDGTEASDKGEVLGHALSYDTSLPVNDGKDMVLTLWTDPEVEPFFSELAEKYHNIHPNITIKVVSQPWSDYWTKLPLALKSGAGPDLYRAHTQHFVNTAQFSYELPEDVFPRDQLLADFPNYETCKYDDTLYTIPLGFSTGAGIYYNKAMWAEAGLTEADIPTTWDQFEEVGKKLVKKDENGNVIQYGFSVDHAFEGFIDTMNYTSGLATFQEDMFHYALDNEITYKNIERMLRWKDEFMMYTDGDAEDQFGHEQTAMIGHWNWVAGYFNATYPDVEWGFFLCPTEDGKEPLAYDRMDTEVTLAVSATDEAKRAVAFDVLKYYACEQNTYLKHCARIGLLCANKYLVGDPIFDDLPNLKTLSTVADKFVTIGNVPNVEARNKAMRAAGSDIFINGKDPREVIPAVLDQLNRDAEKNNITYESIENQYKNYDQLVK